MQNKSKGFTLAELLIVVAIIAVLVAISIPIFSSQLEKSREATDLANIRSAYAEVMADATTGDTSSSLYDSFLREYIKIVYLKQTKDGWDINSSKLNVGGISRADSSHWKGDAKGGGRCEVVYNTTRNDMTLVWDGYTIKPNYQWKYDINASEKKLSPSDVSVVPEGWPASAVPEFIEAKNNSGQKLTVESISDKYPKLKAWLAKGGGYEIGYFITDENGKILEDSGGQSISADSAKSFEISTDEVPDGTKVNIAIQFFKMKDAKNHDAGSVEMTEEEARELERIFSIKNAE